MDIKSDRLGPGQLQLGATGTPEQWADSITKILIEPKVEDGDKIDVLSGKTLARDADITYELQATGLQSYAKDSLIEWAFEHRLQEVPFTWVPLNSSKRGRRGIVRVTPITDGGDVKKRNSSDFTWAIVGEPEYYDVE